MSCDYGCRDENPNTICARCGHPKSSHLGIHPHICVGVYDKERVHVVESCNCPGFQLARKSPPAEAA